jgi:transposase
VDAIRVPLDLDGFEVIDSEVVNGTLEVEVRSVHRPVCHHCGSLDVSGHQRNIRRIRDRTCGYPTVLLWHQRRFRCRDCRRTARERHPEIAGRRSITNRFRRHLFDRAVREPFAWVAAAEKVSGYRVVEAFDAHASEELDCLADWFPRVVNVDESAFRRMFRYHTVFSDPERGAVFELVEERSQAAAELGFSLMSPGMRAAIETVVVDCFPPYRQAAERWVPWARIVLDKFHAMRMVDDCAHRVRTRVSRKRATNLPNNRSGHQFDRRVRRLRWAFSKRADTLAGDERVNLFAMFELYPEIGVAWLLKEEFASIYDASDRDEAARRLQVWKHHVVVSGIGEFIRMWWRTLGAWEDQILSYFDDRVTNAFAEGITNKVKVIKRSAYGFRNPMRYRSKVLLACGRRRKPGADHRSTR